MKPGEVEERGILFETVGAEPGGGGARVEKNDPIGVGVP